MSLNSQKYGFGIRDQEKTYSGSRGQKGTGSRIRIHNNVWQLRGLTEFLEDILNTGENKFLEYVYIVYGSIVGHQKHND
jgi:hypothetical protein